MKQKCYGEKSMPFWNKVHQQGLSPCVYHLSFILWSHQRARIKCPFNSGLVCPSVCYCFTIPSSICKCNANGFCCAKPQKDCCFLICTYSLRKIASVKSKTAFLPRDGAEVYLWSCFWLQEVVFCYYLPQCKAKPKKSSFWGTDGISSYVCSLGHHASVWAQVHQSYLDQSHSCYKHKH